MCGVYGRVKWEGIDEVSNSKSPEYLEILSHRGPDFQSSEQVDDFCILGNTRLAIIDVEGSVQPLTCNCGNHHLTFNGEIFNFHEIRGLLNYDFKTDGDAETLLALICLRGVESLKDIRGQFAFSLWNSHRKKLSLGTDYFGILPMYVYETPEEIVFSSSAKAIGSMEKLNIDLDFCREAVNTKFFNASRTGFKGVEKIPPGSLWEYANGFVKKTVWRDYRNLRPNNDGVEKKLLALLNQSADRVSIGEGKIGTFLSGGLDSAIVSTLVQHRLNYNMTAYTAEFSVNSNILELDGARKLAQMLNFDFKPITINEFDWWANLFEASQTTSNPLVDPADVAVYLLAKEAKKDVKVVVSGEGADELFGGYKKYRFDYLANLFPTKHLASFLLATFGNGMSAKSQRMLASLSVNNQYDRWASYFDVYPREKSVNQDSHSMLASTFDTPSHRAWDLCNYLTLLLDRADSMCMANSIESRPMFLDDDLARFAFTLEKSNHVGLMRSKPLLRKAASTFLPAEIVNKRKDGFSMPIAKWFLGPLNQPIRNYLIDSRLFTYKLISESEIDSLLSPIQSPKQIRIEKIFRLLSLSIWVEKNERRRD